MMTNCNQPDYVGRPQPQMYPLVAQSILSYM